MSENYRQASRKDWHRDAPLTNDDLKLGCLQRIALPRAVDDMSQAQFHAEVMAELEQIEVSGVFPPIPTTAFDYRATRKGYEPGEAIGYGPTEQAAIQDLIREEQQ